jgi:hypothetical protein
MSCDEAREQLSAWLDDALTFDERGALDAHLHACAECRRELTRLEHAVSLLQAVEPARAPAGFVDRVVGAARRVPRHRRLLRRQFWPLEVKLPLGAAAVVLVSVTALYLYWQSPELQQATLVEAPPPPAAVPRQERPVAPTSSEQAGTAEPPSAPTKPAPAGDKAVTEREATPSESAPATAEPERQAAQLKSQAERAKPPPAVTARPQEGAPAAAAPDPTGRRGAGETEPARSATRAKEAVPGETGAPATTTPPPPAHEAEPRAVAPPRPPQSETSRDVGRTAPLTARPEVREETAKAPRPPLAAAPPSAETFGSARAPGPADVSGELRVGDRAAAREALAALVARLGGVQLSPPGQGVVARAEVIEVLVPRGAYRDLTDALAKLGQWRPEREPMELPPMVRVTLHIVD